MNSSRIALTAAAAAAASWTLKAIAIGTAGGLDRSPFEAPLFFTGLAFFVVSTVALGVSLVHGRSTGRRALAGAVALPIGMAVGSLVTWLLTFAEPVGTTHWVWEEVGLWAMALILLAAAVALHGRHLRVGAAT